MNSTQMIGNMNQFDIYKVDLNPTQRAEMRKTRPAVIISPNAMNRNLKTVIIAPLTRTIKGYPSRILTHFGNQPGEVVLDQIREVDKSRLKQRQGKMDAITAVKIKRVLATMFS